MPRNPTYTTGEPLRTQLKSVPTAESISPVVEKADEQNQQGQLQAVLDMLVDYEDYDDAKEQLLKLEQMSESLEQEANINRDLRYTNIDVVAEKQSGKLAPDEIYTPIHLIDTNIRREQAKIVAYITSSRRAYILRCVEKPDLSVDLMEQDFTTRCRYDGWKKSFFRVIDGMQLHKHGIFEVMFDDSKPGDFIVEDIPYEDFPMYTDTRDIQASEMLMRRVPFTKTQLAYLVVKRGFDSAQIQKVISSFEQKKDVSTVKIEKVFFRKDGVVYVGWSCVKYADGWLREPRKLFLGKKSKVGDQFVDTYESKYPFAIAPYNISEDTCLSDGRGRAALDQWDQDAMSSLQSSFITAHRRASGFYWANDTDDPNSTGKVTNLTLRQGQVIDKKMQSFQLSPPDSSMLTATQSVSQFNSQQQSSIDFTAMNREDSKKTATEIQAAQAEGAMLSTTQVSVFADAMQQVGQMCFEIYVSRVVAGYIKPPVPLGMYVMYTYQVKPAGDVDVIERQETLTRMLQLWPIVSQTAISVPYLQKLLMLAFPNDAVQWVQLIQEDQVKNQLLMSLSTVLKSAITDPQTGHLEPQFEHDGGRIVQLFNQVQQVLQGGQEQQGQKAPQGTRTQQQLSA